MLEIVAIPDDGTELAYGCTICGGPLARSAVRYELRENGISAGPVCDACTIAAPDELRERIERHVVNLHVAVAQIVAALRRLRNEPIARPPFGDLRNAGAYDETE